MTVQVPAANAVEIIADADTWCVLLTEAGETTRHLFELELFAVSFATGQRFRLGISTRPIKSEALTCSPETRVV